MPGLLEGKVGLVTGAGSGLGRATSQEMARNGARVVVSDVDDDGGRETVDGIEKHGGEAIYVRADVSRAGEVTALVGATVRAYGRLDCAVNNAGIGGVTNDGRRLQLHEYPDDTWAQVLDVNLTGVFLCLKQEIAQMLGQGGGTIVNIASIAGLVGGFGTAYTASKHGVVGLTRSAALSYATQGIRVNAVCPGVIRTPLTERAINAFPGVEDHWLAMEPIGRFGVPSEVGTAVTWLLSDAASFVTGIAMPVDGGWTAQ
jgi:NAD(P)-dependent dehydrogenase (short-subunit alcohol dehydrogenase family)